jgi:hypothetical protein
MRPRRAVPAALHGALPALILALASGALAAPAPETPAARRAAEERALLRILDEGRREVEALARALDGLPDGPACRALQRRIAELKLETRARLLRTRAGFALARGDLDDTRECERVLAALEGLRQGRRPGDPARPRVAPDGERP